MARQSELSIHRSRQLASGQGVDKMRSANMLGRRWCFGEATERRLAED